jgi:hypothetical protein
LIIRHEINLLNGTLVQTSTSATANAVEQQIIDGSKFNGTVSYSVEVVATNTSSGLCNFGVSGLGGPAGVIPASTSTFTLFRVDSQTWSGANFNFNLFLFPLTAAGTVTIKAARVIIIQNTGTNNLTASETQIEIGNRQLATTVTSTSAAQALSAPKYWKYDSSLWDGTLSVYGELTYLVSSTTGNKTFTIQQDDGTLTSWTDVCTILSASTGSTTATRVRSSASFIPISGRTYRLAMLNSSTMSTISIYNAKVIIQSTATVKESQTQVNAGSSYFFGNDATRAFIGQSFTTTSTYSLSAVQIDMYFNGTPTDSVYAELYSDSLLTNKIATSSTVFASQIAPGSSRNSTSIVLNTFTFPSNPALTNGTKYYIIFRRTALPDSVNYYAIYTFPTNPYSGGSYIAYTGAEVSTDDISFRILSGEVTKIEEQYLLANTTLAAGTALQNFRTTYDPAEWSGVDTNFMHQVDASASNTSVVELDTAVGVQLGGSVISSPNIIGQSQLIDSSITQSTSGSLSNGGFPSAVGQAITGNGLSVNYVTFRVNTTNAGPLTGSMTAYIYASTGTFGTSAIPTGTPLATSQSISASILISNFADMRFYFNTSFTLVNGTKYFVVLSYPYDGSNGNGSSVGYVFGTPASHAGNLATYNGGTWSASSTSDLYFLLYGSITMPTTSTVLDVKATTNSGSIFGSRMLARINKTTTVVTQTIIKALAMLGVG